MGYLRSNRRARRRRRGAGRQPRQVNQPLPGAAARGGAWQFEPLEKRILLSADPVQFLATLTDIDGDGVDEVIVGTHDAEQAGEQRGEVRVLSGADGSVLHTFAGEGQDSRFGWAVGDS